MTGGLGKFHQYMSVLLVCTALICSTASISFAATQVNVSINSNEALGNNNLSLGFELTSDIYTFRSSSTIRELAKAASFKLLRFINNVIEPCTSWQESTKTGTFNWVTVDDLVRKTFDIGAQPLICLGFFNWVTNNLEVPRGMTNDPTTGLPKRDQWAAYCASWVKHFKDANLPVRYYEIVNEAFFYYGYTPTQPKLGYYFQFFNASANAMRTADPNVKISFDDSNKKTALNYFISQGGKLDYISFHRYGVSTIDASDQEVVSAAETKYIEDSSAKYGLDTARQVYMNARGVYLPVIMSEGNMNSAYSSGTDSRTRKMLGAVYTALSIRAFMLKNLMYTVYHILSSSGTTSVGMIDSATNKPWYPYYAQQMIANNLAVGDKMVESSSSSSDVRVIAWVHNKTLNTLLICTVNEARTVYLSGLRGTSSYLKIDNTYSWETPKVQTGSLVQAAPLTLNGYAVALVQSEAGSQPPSTLIFDDGFESGDFSRWSGTTVSSGETAAVVSTLPHDGTRSAKFTSSASSSFENSYCYRNVVSSTELHTRGDFYISQSGTTNTDDRFYLVMLTAGNTYVAYAGWRRTNGGVKWCLVVRDGTNYVTVYSSGSPSTGRWYSVELHWKKDAANGIGELWVDGTKVCSISNRNTSAYGNVSQVRTGLNALFYCDRTTVYCDSVKVSPNYIGPS